MAKNASPVSSTGRVVGMSENACVSEETRTNSLVNGCGTSCHYHRHQDKVVVGLILKVEGQLGRMYPTPAVWDMEYYVGNYDVLEHEQQLMAEFVQAWGNNAATACIAKAVASSKKAGRQKQVKQAVYDPLKPKFSVCLPPSLVPKQCAPNALPSLDWPAFITVAMTMPAREVALPGKLNIEDITPKEAKIVRELRRQLKLVSIEKYTVLDRMKKLKAMGAKATPEMLRDIRDLSAQVKVLTEQVSVYPQQLTWEERDIALYWLCQQYVDRAERYDVATVLDVMSGQPTLMEIEGEDGDQGGLSHGEGYRITPYMTVVERRRCLVCLNLFQALEMNKGGKVEDQEDFQAYLQKHISEQTDRACGANCRIRLGVDGYDVARRVADKEERVLWKGFTPGSAPVHDIIKLMIGDEKICDVDGKEALLLDIGINLCGMKDDLFDAMDPMFRRENDQARKTVLDALRNAERVQPPHMTARIQLRLLQGGVCIAVGGGFKRGETFYVDGHKYLVVGDYWYRGIGLLDSAYGLMGCSTQEKVTINGRETMQSGLDVDMAISLLGSYYNPYVDANVQQAMEFAMRDGGNTKYTKDAKGKPIKMTTAQIVNWQKRVKLMPLRKNVLVTFFLPMTNKCITEEEYVTAWERVLLEEGDIPASVGLMSRDKPFESVAWSQDLESVHMDLLKRKQETIAVLRVHLWDHIRHNRHEAVALVGARIAYLTHLLALEDMEPMHELPMSIKRDAKYVAERLQADAFVKQRDANFDAQHRDKHPELKDIDAQLSKGAPAVKFFKKAITEAEQAAYDYVNRLATLEIDLKAFAARVEDYVLGKKDQMGPANMALKVIQREQERMSIPITQMAEALTAMLDHYQVTEDQVRVLHKGVQ
ncbi:MAG: hypothetical protein WCK39_00170 [Methanomassiliicoccales archaeon]